MPERLAVQLDPFPLGAVPLAGLQIGVGLRHVARLRQEQRHGVLGRRQDVRLRRVDHHHAAPCGFGDVDVVEADTGATDHDEIVGRGEELGGDLGRAADHQCVRTLDRREQLFRREADLHVDVEPGVAHRVEPTVGERFGDKDAGCHRRPR